MEHACANVGGGGRDCPGAAGLDGLKALLTAFIQDPGQVDHDGGVMHGGGDRCRKPHVGLHGMDLTDVAERLQMPGEVGTTHNACTRWRPRNPDPPKTVTRVSMGWSMRAQSRLVASAAGPEYRIADGLYRGSRAAFWGARRRALFAGQRWTLTMRIAGSYVSRRAQVAELVDALVSGTSGESRGGSSPLLATRNLFL